MSEEIYTEVFWEMNARHATALAGPVAEYLADRISVRSLVDLGCGQAIILARVAVRCNAKELMGIDGSYAASRVRIPPNRFLPLDLETANLHMLVQNSFDLAMCLEVVEHLTFPAADRIIDWMCGHASVILFSAAIPGQGGYGHINEQWPSYWIERFKRRDFEVDGAVRAALWDRQEIPCYYRQNLLMFYRRGTVMRVAGSDFTQDVVHPELYTDKTRG